VLENNPRVVELVVDGLLPEGTTLEVEERVLRSGTTRRLTADIESDLSALQALLATRPLAITRPELVERVSTPPASAADRDPEAVRATLDAHLNARQLGPDQKSAVMARYDAISPAIVTSPKLRAALAGLTGTFAGPAIDDLLTAQNCTGQPAALIAFQPPPDYPDLAARGTRDPAGRRVVSINPNLEGERIELLMALIAHEAIHCDLEDGRFEEIAANALETFLFMGFLVADPSIIEPVTTLGREYVIATVAMVNSGFAVPESIGILPSPGVAQALPGTNAPFASYADYVAASYDEITHNESPEERLARSYILPLAQLAGMAAGNAFDLRYLDALLGRSLPPEALLFLVQLLELEPV
jgi:hypothetical protein